MVLELPKATTTPFIPQEAFLNIYGDMVDAEQALEVTARESMESEYTTGGDRMESIVTPLLIARWQQVHDNKTKKSGRQAKDIQRTGDANPCS
jgi:hypothetical protein